MNDRIDPPGAESEGPGPADAGLSVDEKFAKLVAEIGGGAAPTGPAPKEEAARTRELRAKWSANPPQAVGWRTDGPSTLTPSSGPVEPDEPPRRRRRTARRWVPVVLVVAAVIGAFGYVEATSPSTSVPVDTAPAGTGQPWSQGLSPSPSPSVSYANPDDAYFAGSPAIDWKDNEAGFSVPRASEVHGVGSDDVATGYKLLEKVMEAGNLDATILDGGSTADFTDLLDPASDEYKQLDGWIAHPSYNDDPTQLISRFNPATTRLLGHMVKVNGSMSASAGPQSGSAYLTANYVFVYAVGPANGDRAQDMRVTVHRTVQIEIFNSGEYQTEPDKAWISDDSSDASNITCYQYDGFIDPGFSLGGPAPNETGTADPYATGNLLTQSAQPTPSSTVGECQAVSGD
jgi:hypothetical protein